MIASPVAAGFKSLGFWVGMVLRQMTVVSGEVVPDYFAAAASTIDEEFSGEAACSEYYCCLCCGCC